MQAIKFDQFEKMSLEIPEINVKEGLRNLHASFDSKIDAMNGIYGVEEIDKGNGQMERVVRTDEGLQKFYYQDGELKKSRLRKPNRDVVITTYDDLGVPYMEKITKAGETVVPKDGRRLPQLLPNTKATLGEFTAITDNLGRPIRNKMTNLSIREGGRDPMNIEKTSGYRVTDDKGHPIAAVFNGPTNELNILPQDARINRGQYKRMEHYVRKLVEDGHKVDLEIKINYVDNTERPSSFEPRITVDGKKQEVPEEFKKIYNEIDLSDADKSAITAIERTHSRNVRIDAAKNTAKEYGTTAAAMAFAVSTVDNVTAFVSNEISAEDMVFNIAKETGVAGAIGYGTGFITSEVQSLMLSSGHELIQSLGDAGVAASVINFGVQSFDSISAFASGEIDAEELFYDLGENAAGIAGSTLGSAGATAIATAITAGATAGTAATAAAVGSVALGLAGGMAGCAVAGMAYSTAVQHTPEIAGALATKAQDIATSTYELAKAEVPAKAELVRDSINKFANTNNLPFSV